MHNIGGTDTTISASYMDTIGVHDTASNSNLHKGMYMYSAYVALNLCNLYWQSFSTTK